jgi:hypothetical protein
MATLQRGSAAYESYVADLRASGKETFDVQEDYSWEQVCAALCPPTAGHGAGGKKQGGSDHFDDDAVIDTGGAAGPGGYNARAEVPVVDVVHLSPGDGSTRQWFFTSRSGRISRKSKKNSTLESVFATFQDIAKSYGTSDLAVVRRGSSATIVPNGGMEAFRIACVGADSVSAFIPPKGSTDTANFRDAYTRTGAGASTLVTYRVGAPLGVLGKTQRTSPRSSTGAASTASLSSLSSSPQLLSPTGGSSSSSSSSLSASASASSASASASASASSSSSSSSSVSFLASSSNNNKAMVLGRGETISAATSINRVLNGYTAKIVRALENFNRCSVLSLSAMYVVDEDDTAWLVHVRDVRVGRNSNSNSSNSSSSSSSAADIPRAGRGGLQRASTAPHGVDGSSSTHSRGVGADVNSTSSVDESSVGGGGHRAMQLTASQQIARDNRRAVAGSLRAGLEAGAASAQWSSSLAPHELPQLAKQGPTGYGGASSSSSSSSSSTTASTSTWASPGVVSPTARRRGSGGGGGGGRSGRLTALNPRSNSSTSSSSAGEFALERYGGSSGGSEDGQQQGAVAEEAAAAALARAQTALDALTKKELTELRTYTKPPASVVLVTRAVMLLLTGHALEWAAAKRVMANSDRFLLMLASLDRHSLPAARLRALQPFLANPAFRPEAIEPTSIVAARFCSWVLGIHDYATSVSGGDGSGDEDATASTAMTTHDGLGPTSRQSSGYGFASYGDGNSSSSSSSSFTSSFSSRQPAPVLSMAKQGSMGYRTSAVDTRPLRDTGRRSPPVPGALRLTNGTRAADVPVDPDVAEAAAVAAARLKREKAAKQKMRRQQLARLAKSDDGGGGSSGLGDTEGVSSFIAVDGALMP